MRKGLKKTVDIDDVFEEGDPIDRALALEIHLAIRRHKLLEESIVVWRDDKPTRLSANEIQIEFDRAWFWHPIVELDETDDI